MKTVIFLSCFLLASVAGIRPSSGQAAPDNSNVLFTSSDDDMELEELPTEDVKDTTEADKMLRLRRMVQS
ncbi:MAG: hypothetical protein CVU59_03810, partial [Deltaproteobacteria bacterium HGW-Deltaproteobacteria-17]